MRLERLLGVFYERLIFPGIYAQCKQGIIFVNIQLVDQTNMYINIHMWLNVLWLCFVFLSNNCNLPLMDKTKKPGLPFSLFLRLLEFL